MQQYQPQYEQTTESYPVLRLKHQNQQFDIQQNQQFGRHSISTLCPYCKEQIETIIRNKIGKHAWKMSGTMLALGLVGTGLGFLFILPWVLTPLVFVCWIPLAFPSFKDVQHFCPNCDNLLGVCEK